MRESVFVKLVFIAFLVLVLLVPMSLIESVIGERQELGRAASANVMSTWGGEQVVGGPLLVVPYRVPVLGDADEITGWTRSKLFVLPRRLEVRGSLAPEYRYRGIHRVAVYTARAEVSAHFAPLPVSELLPAEAVIDWRLVRVALLVSDARAITSGVRLSGDLGTVDFVPGGVQVPGLPPMLTAAAPALEHHDGGFELGLRLDLAGSARFAVLPMGDETRVWLSAPWASPSFEGAWLPADRDVDASGFRARWKVLHLGRGFPSHWRDREVEAKRIGEAAFGVRLFQSVPVYQQATRAAKYAVLFIGLSFVAWFMLEIHCRRLLHPLQYLLVGFANCMFYLLLVALSEHIVFGMAYLLAAGASTSLIAGYSASVLASRRLAAGVGALLAGTYGFLFVVLRAEDFAMLMGALASFAVLAAIMFLTRRIDWYALSLGNRELAEHGA
jgi:inner membrane protein